MKNLLTTSVSIIALSLLLCGCNTKENFVKTSTSPVPTQRGFAQLEQLTKQDIADIAYEKIGNFSVEKTAYSTMFAPTDEAIWEEFQARAIKHGAQAVLDYNVKTSEVFDHERTFERKTATGTLIVFEDEQPTIQPQTQPSPPTQIKNAPLAPLKQASDKIGTQASQPIPETMLKNDQQNCPPAKNIAQKNSKTAKAPQTQKAAVNTIKARKRQYTVIGPVKVRKQALMSFLSVKDKEILRMLRQEAKKLGGDDVIDIEITTVKNEYDGRKFEEKTATAKAVKFK